MATENKAVGQSMDLIKAELERVAEEGLSEQELRTAKDYLIGSFALRFDTSAKIAQQLLAIQQDNLGIDYIDRRNGEVEAVTARRHQAHRQAPDGAEEPDRDRGGSAGRHPRRRALGSLDAPLTPALSPRGEGVRLFNSCDTASPLPWGEGRGEGSELRYRKPTIGRAMDVRIFLFAFFHLLKG